MADTSVPAPHPAPHDPPHNAPHEPAAAPNQVSLPRWAELKHEFLARQAREHFGSTTSANEPAKPGPIPSED